MKTIEHLALDAIAPSHTNPRKHHDAKADADLAESVRQHGVIQPILVRPLPGGKTRVIHAVTLPGERDAWGVGRGDLPDTVTLRTGLAKRDAERLAKELADVTHEIVAGERRWRAATAAGLTEIPALVRPLDDKTALEIQVIENLQREGLHPLEEAEGYDNLMKHHAYTAEQLAAKVGKSKGYIYARLKLIELGPEGRKALWDGKLDHSKALLLARIHDPALQKKALGEALGGKWNGPMSEKELRRHLQENYMLRLSDAPFDPRDAELVPDAGACAHCPKRTGNQKELFPDVQSADVCTDPPCFARKKDAAAARKLDAAAKAGQEVLPTQDTFNQYGHLKDEFVELSDRCDKLGWGHKKDWRQTLGKLTPTPIVTVDAKGATHEIVRAKDAQTALKASGHKPKPDRVSRATSAYETKKKMMLKAAALAAGQILPRLTAPLMKAKDRGHKKLWALLAQAAYDCTDIDVHALVARRRGLVKSQADAREALEKLLKKTEDPAALMALSLELLLLARWDNGGWQTVSWSSHFKALAALAKVNLKKIEKQAAEKPKGKGKRAAKANP